MMFCSKYLPSFLFQREEINIGFIGYYYYTALLFFVYLVIKSRLGMLSLRYKRYTDGELHNNEVENIYNREAKKYEKKHHLTTNYRDTWWRRQSGTDVISFAKRNNLKRVNLLDIATGVGLSVEEMFKMFNLYEVEVTAQAIDYNTEMLNCANDVVYKRMKV